MADDKSLDLDGAVLETALASTSASIRDLTWWKVAALLADDKLVPASATMPPSVTMTAGDTRPEIAFGREMAARVLKQPRAESQALIVRLHETADNSPLPPFVRKALVGPLFRFLTEREQEALNTGRPPDHRLTGKRARVPDWPKDYGAYRRLRTVSDLPNGLTLDLLRQLGCPASDTGIVGAAVVQYGADRSVKGIEFFATRLSKPCATAVRYLSIVSAIPAPREMSAEKKDIILVPMHEAFLTCLDGPATSVSPDFLPSVPVPPIGIVPPKKTRNVQPVYPKDAQSRGRQGLVIVETVISPEGCVNRGEILQGVSFDLDVSAMLAVTGWQYTPTLLNGKPVPVLMAVTVQFSLR